MVAGETDHLTPWPSCYRTTKLLGGRSRFVLSTSGHIAAVIHPPGNPRSSYRIGDEAHDDPQDWLASAQLHKGTWWEDWAPWIAARSGALKPAPKRLGTRRHKPLERAPGTYVFDRSQG